MASDDEVVLCEVILASDDEVALASDDEVVLASDDEVVVASDDEVVLASDDEVVLTSDDEVVLTSDDGVALNDLVVPLAISLASCFMYTGRVVAVIGPGLVPMATSFLPSSWSLNRSLGTTITG